MRSRAFSLVRAFDRDRRRRRPRSACGGGGSGAGSRGVGARGRGGCGGGGHALAFLRRGCREDRSHSRGCARTTHSCVVCHRVSPSSRRRARRHARPGAHRGTAAADAARSSVHGVVVELLVHAPRERVCVHGESPCVVPRADGDVLAHDAFQADDAGGHAVAEGRQQGVRVRSELLRRLRVDDEGRVRESRGWGGVGREVGGRIPRAFFDSNGHLEGARGGDARRRRRGGHGRTFAKPLDLR